MKQVRTDGCRTDCGERSPIRSAALCFADGYPVGRGGYLRQSFFVPDGVLACKRRRVLVPDGVLAYKTGRVLVPDGVLVCKRRRVLVSDGVLACKTGRVLDPDGVLACKRRRVLGSDGVLAGIRIFIPLLPLPADNKQV